MKTFNSYIYLVEGETEAKAIKVLKEKYIISGKIRILHQKRISHTLLRTLPVNSSVILVFDTDISSTASTIKKNIEILKKDGNNLNVILIPQIRNLEEEFIFSTSIKDIKELLNSKSRREFKSDFIKEKNCLKKLEEKNFNIEKFWSREADKSSGFSGYKNSSNKIKYTN